MYKVRMNLRNVVKSGVASLAGKKSLRNVAMIASLAVGSVLVSCNKGDEPKPPDTPKDVYAVFVDWDYNTSKPNMVLWKNGDKTIISTEGTALNSGVTPADVFVNGQDVYIVGDVYTGGDDYYVAKIWKNGVETILNKGGYRATSLYVNNNDVYVSGYRILLPNGTGENAILWKNGVETILPNADKNTRASDVFVSNNDIYVAGYGSNDVYSQWGAKFWKNGIVTNISNGSDISVLSSIAVANNNVYIVGYEGNYATFWKNGVATRLTDGANAARAQSVFVSGNDVYIAGYEQTGGIGRVAKLWKNGIATNLVDGTKSTVAMKICVSNNDVYCVGYSYDNDDENIAYGVSYARTATLWRNGVAQSLTNEKGTYCSAIFVK